MKDLEHELQGLLTRLADAQDGYREGADLAESPMMVTLLSYLYSTHMLHSLQLKDAMTERGMAIGEPGSAMNVVHKAIMNIRSILSGLDERIIPGIVDGEMRVIASYDDLIVSVGGADDALRNLLQAQRSALIERVDELDSMQDAAGVGGA